MRIIRKGEGQTATLDFAIPPNYKVYLSGGMEYSDDYGAGWRDTVQNALKTHEFTFYNPCKEEKPVLLSHGIKNSNQLFALKNWKDLPKAATVVNDLLIKDRNEVYKSDALIVYYDESTQLGGGTAMEQAWTKEAISAQKNKPIFFIIDKSINIKNTSLSMLAMSNYVFETLEDCIIYLKRARDLYESITE